MPKGAGICLVVRSLNQRFRLTLVNRAARELRVRLDEMIIEIFGQVGVGGGRSIAVVLVDGFLQTLLDWGASS
jgi:hypothetical protein